MSFEVTILGSGSALPTLRRNPTAQYIACNDRHILIDCGEGTQSQLRKFGIKIQKINLIFISHMHGDHFFGLVGLLSSMHLLGRDNGITIYGPKELEQIIRLQLEIGGAKMNFNLNFIELDNSKPTVIFEDKMIEVHSFPMKHRIPVNGFKIQEKEKEFNIIGEVFKESGLSLMSIPFFKNGEDFVDENGQIHYAEDFIMAKKSPKSYAYCSDTAYFEPLIPSIQGVNLLYHEATFAEKLADRAKATFHSTAKDAATIAQKANVGKLILGHLSARYDSGDDHLKEAQTIFENTVIAEDGMIFQV
jgi:ribonuclease Z